jgi:foldase protein PrsA
MTSALRLFTAVLIAVVLAGCGSATDTAAIVDGGAISASSIQAASDRFEGTSTFEQQAQQSSAGEAERTFQQTWLSRTIRARVLEDAAAKRGIEVKDSEVEQQIEQIKQANFKTEKEYRKALAAQGLTEPVLRQLVREGLLEQRLQVSVTQSVTPSVAQLKRIYRRNIADYQETRTSHILVKESALARRLYARLRGLPPSELRKEFADLAAKYSIDEKSGAKGGDIGFRKAGQLVPEYEEAMNGLKVGELSRPVRSEFGYHIILVTGRRKTSFEEARAQIASEAAQKKKDEAWNAFLEARFEAADIEVNPAYGRFSPTVQEVVDVDAGHVPGTDEPAPTAPGTGPIAPPQGP